MRRFKISGCTANFGRADLFRIVDRLAHHGYDGVEVTVMYHAPPDETSAGRRREIKNHIRQSGLAISALHFIFPPEMRMASEDGGERDRTVRHAEAVLDLASDLEAPTIMIGAPAQRSIPASVARELGLSRVLEVFTKIARKAEQTGTIVCFEALNRYETNVGRTLAECASYVEQIGSPNLMVGGDTFHMNIDEADMGKAVENVAHRLGHLHVEDSHRMAPGGGHIDFAPIFSALRRAEYSRFLSFEMFGIAPDIPYLPTFEACDVEAAKAVERVRAVESMLE